MIEETRTIRRTALLADNSEVIWDKLLQLETLQYIARPYACFSLIKGLGDTSWREGATAHLRLRLYGWIPMGIHSITIVHVDHEKHVIRSHEKNHLISIWNHQITLRYAQNDLTEYTDEVEIGAGWITSIVCAWAKLFYAHRQRRWRKLLSTSISDTHR